MIGASCFLLLCVLQIKAYSFSNSIAPYVVPKVFQVSIMCTSPGADGALPQRKFSGLNSLDTLYQFSRPHTIKGTILASSMAVLRAIAEYPEKFCVRLLPKALLGIFALLCGNTYIVGINQIFDERIDIINKPYLPIAAKQLSKKGAWVILAACFAAGMGIVKTQFSPIIFRLYLVGGLLGTIYSVPPIQLKRFPALAAVIIATVRGFLLNFGVYYAVREALGVPFRWNPVVVFISAFMTVFASVIAITKDLSDVAGDKQYGIATFASTYGVERTAAAATCLLGGAYLAAAALPFFSFVLVTPHWSLRSIGSYSKRNNSAFRLLPMCGGHCFLLSWLLRSHRRLKAEDPVCVAAFYRSIWSLFYLEYALYLFI